MQLVTVIIFTSILINKGQSIIIRNDITDRCLHIGLLGRNNKESLYATSCTWNTADDSQSHPHENLEIIPAFYEEKDRDQENLTFHIKKDANNTETNTCLSTINNQPGVSHDCTTSEASFFLDNAKQDNFKGILTTKLSFKIRNVAGKCLAVQPGQPFLKFKACLPQKGLFQVWSVCRHNRKCDVDFAWTPRSITFPQNNTTDNQTKDDKIAESAHKNDLTHATNVMENSKKKDGSRNTIINEVLYTMQNAEKTYNGSEQYLMNGIAAFYTAEDVSKAQSVLLNICQEENIKCSQCTQCREVDGSTNTTVEWIMRWMTECNLPSHVKMFLSNDMFQVPHYLFPSNDPSYFQALPSMEKYKQIITNLKKYLRELEARLHEHDKGKPPTNNSHEELNSSNSVNASESDKLHYVKPVVGNSNASSHNQVMNATQDYVSIIDVRLFNG